MSDTPYIPQKTVDEINAPHVPGQRHQAMIKIAMSLLGNGIPDSAVFATLREKFPAQDIPEKEIENVIVWCRNKSPKPSGDAAASTFTTRSSFRSNGHSKQEQKKRTPAEQVAWWLSGFDTTLEKTISSSQIPIPENPKESAVLTVEMLYAPDECINIVTNHTVSEAGKAIPQGAGKTLTRDEWCRWFNQKGIPQSQAGAWIRPNPCSAIGTGNGGAITDADIQAHRFLLLESDMLPLNDQLAIYRKLKLPIAMITLSGGKSAHAWVKLDCADEATYRETSKRIIESLAPFGIDPANKNPSRLSRLPGAIRKIGACGDGMQRLIYLRVKTEPLTPAALSLFEESLKLPAIDDKPMKRLMIESLDRYDKLYANRGKIGVQTGFREFDLASGGLKARQMTVIAAETSVGKSSFCLNILNNATKNGTGAVLFTLEMDREEITDMLVSMNCEVNRNIFNTGYFSESDSAKIKSGLSAIAAMPFWIEDEAVMSVSYIRQRILQLKSEGKIGIAAVDYAQLINPEDAREPREQQVAGIGRSLRILSKEASIPILVLSQVNDDGKLRESRALAHDAHNVIVLESTDETMNMTVVKGRSIPKGEYRLKFEPFFCRIKDFPKISDDDVRKTKQLL